MSPLVDSGLRYCVTHNGVLEDGEWGWPCDFARGRPICEDSEDGFVPIGYEVDVERLAALGEQFDCVFRELLYEDEIGGE